MATWNVNGKRPGESLQHWITLDHLCPDVIGIAFQELDLSAENFLLGSTPLEALWEEHITSTLSHLKYKYVMVSMKRLVGVLLYVYVKEEHMAHITDIQTGLAATGIMGMMGNKGGVAVRFTMYDSTFCIVNSHLNAHSEGVLRRNQDYHDISRRILFTDQEGIFYFSVFDHDNLFWIGDLNYRINLPDSDVRKKIQNKEWKALQEADQLIEQIAKGTAFNAFLEGPLLFPPTYKFDTGTHNYDTSEKRRTPAWCDRVLWKDHKPVSALFEVKVKHVNRPARSKVYQEIVRQLDKMENESRPSVVLSGNSLDFGKVKYMVPCTRTLKIENTGKVVARYRFIPKLEEATFCKPWMWIEPSASMLGPGETITISFTVNVDNGTAPDFNLKKAKLEDILILHLDGGIDFFITVSGEYLQSSFGSTLSHLIRFPGPVRTSEPLDQSADHLAIPKELWRIVDFIYRKGLKEEDLFLQSAVESEMVQIRECLDTGETFEGYDFDVHSMAETLVRFLESLGEPVIPFDVYDAALECHTYAQCKAVLSGLPSVNYNCFYYLMAFLREVLVHKSKNLLTQEKLAVVFSSVLLRPKMTTDISNPSPSAIEKKKKDFIEHFLNVDDLKP